jgi:IclR family mhp operon transcriptional activator
MAIKQVRALRRGLEVLTALNRMKGASALDLARRTKIPRPTVYRLLETLEEMGFVTRSPTDETWHLTISVRTLSAGYDDETWVRQVALPVVNKLQRAIIWPVDLTTYDRDTMVVRETTHRSSPFSIDPGMAGTRLPMLSTSAGRAYLAFCPEEEREAILERLLRDQTVGERVVIDAMVTQARREGFSRRTDDYRPGTASIAVPVLWDGRVLACMAVIWITSAMTPQQAIDRLLTPLREAAMEVETGLAGYQGLVR